MTKLHILYRYLYKRQVSKIFGKKIYDMTNMQAIYLLVMWRILKLLDYTEYILKFW